MKPLHLSFKREQVQMERIQLLSKKQHKKMTILTEIRLQQEKAQLITEHERKIRYYVEDQVTTEILTTSN